MKNNIVIRLENTLFNTNNINKHLPKAKDKATTNPNTTPGFGASQQQAAPAAAGAQQAPAQQAPAK